MAVLEATGVPQPPDLRDVESIGNRLDIFVKRKFVIIGGEEDFQELQRESKRSKASNGCHPAMLYRKQDRPDRASAAELAYELSAAKERIRSAQMLAERAEQAMAAKVAEEFRVRSVKKRGVEMLAAHAANGL
ncbi:hypothetical protein AB1Y20_020244 [Prymnesium parvum]|uniref:Uncharacterized protein n=1 Tax=Prymnesium parvum TaxID=97485 RepID=A0AB34JXK7_PRYPA